MVSSSETDDRKPGLGKLNMIEPLSVAKLVKTKVVRIKDTLFIIFLIRDR